MIPTGPCSIYLADRFSGLDSTVALLGPCKTNPSAGIFTGVVVVTARRRPVAVVLNLVLLRKGDGVDG